jgi:DNA-binding winged helix-turn-helix (wHTH) protein/tetratricopeptide (TPR) repeat protein
MRTPPPERVLRFDAFTLDLSRCALLRGDVVVPLRPQAFDMLRYLAERPGTLVSKDELVKAIWRKPAVSDDSLVKCIRDIREALGDHDQRIIETVRSRGYLFAANVSATQDGEGFIETGDLPANVSLRVQSLVDNAWRHVFSPRSRGAAVLAAALLIVAASVAAWSMRASPPLPGNAAHYAILGHAILDNERSLKANGDALAHFNKALAIDPNWVPALLGYARVMVIEVGEGWVPPPERAARLDQAKAAAERAVRLEAANYLAQQMLGDVLRMRGDPQAALAALERALALNPSAPWTHALIGKVKADLGRAEEAIRDIETALRINPSELAVHIWYSWGGIAALQAGRSKDAAGWLLKAREANPTYRLPIPLLAVAYAEIGREDKGRALMAEYLATAPGLTMQSLQHIPSWNALRTDRRERITSVLQRLGVPDAKVRTGSVR